MVHCSAEQTRLWCAGERPEGVRNHHALVHRDLLVLHEVAPPSRPATKP
jgi:hypothetical protein